jgi:hypothetical protein
MPHNTNLNYTTKIIFNVSINNGDELKLYYKEKTIECPPLKLATRTPDGVNKRDAMITKSIVLGSTRYYLKDVSINSVTSIDCTYEEIGSWTPATYEVKKRYPNIITLMDYLTTNTLPFTIEFWSESKTSSWKWKHDEQGRPAKMHKGHIIPAYDTNTNNFDYLNTRLNKTGIYHIRFRFNDTNNRPIWSNWYPYHFSVKKFDIFTTNSSFSSDTYQGIYKTAKFIN